MYLFRPSWRKSSDFFYHIGWLETSSGEGLHRISHSLDAATVESVRDLGAGLAGTLMESDGSLPDLEIASGKLTVCCGKSLFFRSVDHF